MSKLSNKIDFVALAAVNCANANGDPLNGNRPRTDYNGFGEMSDVCIKRKLRNRMQDMGHRIFVQSDDRCDDGFGSLSDRAKAVMKGETNRDAYAQKACETWLDVRSFGQVFAFSDAKGVSVGVRGPVSVHQAASISPVEIESMQITKSVNGSASEKGAKRSADTMGMKHYVRFGLYVIKGSVNVQLAEKTGFSHEDAMVLKECLRTLFENDASAARPEGSMEIVKLFWFEHSCKSGQYSSARVHRSVRVALKDEGRVPEGVEDYEITLEELPGLKPEVFDGI